MSQVDVDAFLAAFEHPQLELIQALRQVLKGSDPVLREAIKWNAPSYHMPGHVHCVTLQLRARDGVQLILHLGAQKAVLPEGAIADPEGLLRWLGPDRAAITFSDLADLSARHEALVAIVRQWLPLAPRTAVRNQAG